MINAPIDLFLGPGATLTITGGSMGYSGGVVSGKVGPPGTTLGTVQTITVNDLTSGSPGFTVTTSSTAITFTGN